MGENGAYDRYIADLSEMRAIFIVHNKARCNFIKYR